jgi:hypothetical protein
MNWFLLITAVALRVFFEPHPQPLRQEIVYENSANSDSGYNAYSTSTEFSSCTEFSSDT